MLDVLLRRLVGLFEAIRSYVSDERTSAHAWGIAAPPSCMGRLPEVGSSFGLMLVSTGKARIRAKFISNSSAAICAIAETMPFPISTFPRRNVT